MTDVTDTMLWRPAADANDSAMAQFLARAEVSAGRLLANYDALHAWSIADRVAFWRLLWDFSGI